MRPPYPDDGYESRPPRYRPGYPDNMQGAHFAALDAARSHEVVNFITGTLIAVAGTVFTLYVAATRPGLFAPIFVGTLTALLAGFYFFSYRSLELHRRRLEAHYAYVLSMYEFLRILSDGVPGPEVMKVRAEMLSNITAPVPETTRSAGVRRKDLKAAIDLIRAAAGMKPDSVKESN